MQLPQRPDQQETERRIERALLQELRIRRASPMPDARDAYDDLKCRVLKLLAQDKFAQESPVSRSALQARLDVFLLDEKIILKRHEKRQLTNDILAALSAQQDSAGTSRTPNSFDSIEALIAMSMLSPEAAAYLEAAVRAGENIMISGQAGTGKTTLLRALCRFIPEEESIVTVEETAELLLDRQNLVALEANVPGPAHRAPVPIQTLLLTGARLQPERLILGSLEDSAVFTWLQLVDGIHQGSLATRQAENPQDLLVRIESLIQLADPGLSPQQIRQQIKSAVDLVIHLENQAGHRQVAAFGRVAVLDQNKLMIVDAL